MKPCAKRQKKVSLEDIKPLSMYVPLPAFVEDDCHPGYEDKTDDDTEEEFKTDSDEYDDDTPELSEEEEDEYSSFEEPESEKSKESSCYTVSKPTPCEVQSAYPSYPPAGSGVVPPVAAPPGGVPVGAVAPPYSTPAALFGFLTPPTPRMGLLPWENTPLPKTLNGIPRAGFISPLTNVPTGTGLYERIGSKINVKPILIRCQKRVIPMISANPCKIKPNVLRMLIVCDHQGRKPDGELPYITEILGGFYPDRDPTDTDFVVAHYNPDTRSRFSILYDKTWSLGALNGTEAARFFNTPIEHTHEDKIDTCVEVSYSKGTRSVPSLIPTKNELLLVLVGTDPEGENPSNQWLQVDLSIYGFFTE